MNGLLEGINSPVDLKRLKIRQLPQLASEIRQEIVRVVSRTGGHLASSLGAVELAIALHYVLDSPEDTIVWDVGHQAYAHKLLTGRKERFDSLRQFGGISGFPNKDESSHDPFTVGHASTSISQALGMVVANSLTRSSGRVVAVIGDGALTGGMAFEALNHAGQLGKKIIVVLNSNEMAISPSVGALSKYLNKIITNPLYNRIRRDLRTLVKRIPKLGPKMLTTAQRLEEGIKDLFVPGAFFEELGFRYFGPIDGHNLALLIQALNNIMLINEPILLHLITKKGKGYKFAESDPVRFHSAAPFDVETGISKKSQPAEPNFTETFGSTICELASRDKRIVVITPAMAAGSGLTEFAKIFPDRFFDVGIAEQHALTFAGGLARGGLKPVVAIYSTFLQRAYDQMIHDICLQNLDVVFAIDRAGLVDEDGPTHHGIFDIAYLGHIPNLVLMAPKDEQELKDMIYTAVSLPGPVAIRYPKKGTGRIQTDKDYHTIQLGQAEVLKQGRGPVIMALGSMVYPALKAGEILAEEGIEPTVVNARFIRPLDEALLDELLAKGNRPVITVEEHVEKSGFGSIVLEFLAKKGKKNIKIKRLALPNSFIEQGSHKILLDKYGLSAEAIADSVREAL